MDEMEQKEYEDVLREIDHSIVQERALDIRYGLDPEMRLRAEVERNLMQIERVSDKAARADCERTLRLDPRPALRVLEEAVFAQRILLHDSSHG